MFTVEVTSGFSAAHRLRGYQGKCENVHGHNWKVGVAVSAQELDNTGFVVDFRDIKSMLAEIINGLDHCDLNTHPYFKKKNPTSEHIACYIFCELRKKNARVSSVSVWESDNAKATYTGEEVD